MFVFQTKQEVARKEEPYLKEWIGLIDKTATKEFRNAYYLLKGTYASLAENLKKGYFEMRSAGIDAARAGEYALGFLYSKATMKGSAASANDMTLQQKFEFTPKEIAAIGRLGQELMADKFKGSIDRYKEANGEYGAVNYMLVSLGSSAKDEAFNMLNKIRARVFIEALGADAGKRLADKIRKKTEWLN